MALDDAAPDPQLHPTEQEFHDLRNTFQDDHDTAVAVHDLMRRRQLGLAVAISVHDHIKAGRSEADALDAWLLSKYPLPSTPPAAPSTGAKRPLSLSPPSLSCPTSPPPAIGTQFGKTPTDWRAWIAEKRRAKGGQGTSPWYRIRAEDVA